MFAFVVNGVVRGAAYGLTALGLVLVFRTARVVNFAHGAVATFATFAFVSFRGHLPAPVALVFALGVAAGIGLVIERTTMRPLQERGQAPKLVATLGWLLIVQESTVLVFGRQSRIVAPIFPSGTVSVLGVRVAWYQLALVAVTVALAVALTLWLARTRFGSSLRAVAQDRAAAQLLSVDANRVTAVAWAVSGALAALAGILVAPSILLDSNAMTVLLFHGFAAALIADFSSFPAAVAAGLALGGLEDLLQYFYSKQGASQDLAMFVVLLAVLLARSTSWARAISRAVPWPS